MNLPERDKVDRIVDIYRSLNDDEKEVLVTRIAQEEELLTRLLGFLIEQNADSESNFTEGSGFVDFLKRVKG